MLAMLPAEPLRTAGASRNLDSLRACAKFSVDEGSACLGCACSIAVNVA